MGFRRVPRSELAPTRRHSATQRAAPSAAGWASENNTQPRHLLGLDSHDEPVTGPDEQMAETSAQTSGFPGARAVPHAVTLSELRLTAQFLLTLAREGSKHYKLHDRSFPVKLKQVLKAVRGSGRSEGAQGRKATYRFPLRP